MAGDPESMALLKAAARVIHDDEPLADAPDYLVRRVMDMYSGKPDIIRITLGIAQNLIKVLACPDDAMVFSPAFAGGMRTGEKTAESPMIVIAKIFDTLQVEMEADRGTDGKGCIIRISAAALQPGHELGRLRVMLASQERELFSGPLENGHIVFEDVHPGIYSVVIRSNGRTIGEIALNLVKDATGGTGGE